MQKMNKIILIFLLIFFTHGCKTLKKSLGLEKDVPDEFLIKKIDPIEKPPNFELIPPNSKIKKSSNKRNKSFSAHTVVLCFVFRISENCCAT